MSLDIKNIDNIIIISLNGRLDVHYSSPLEKELTAAVENNLESNFIFNFNNVDYMSSSAIRIFIHIKQELEASNRKIKLCSMNNIVNEVFNITGLYKTFDIFDSENAAIESFR